MLANVIRDRCQAVKRMIVVSGAAEDGKRAAVTKISCVVTEYLFCCALYTKLCYYELLKYPGE